MAGLFDEQNGGLVSYWKTVGSVTALVGTGSSARIASDVAREKWNAPFIIYTRGTGGTIHQHLGGTTGARTSIVHVYCWGDTRTETDALAEAVKLSMQSGFARNSWNGIYVNRCYIEEPQDDGYDPWSDGSDKKKFWSRLVLRIVHAETGGTT